MKALPQPLCLHSYGRSLVWVRMCFLRSLRVVKSFPHPSRSQSKVLPVWSLVWALRRYRVVKADSHPSTEQAKGFSRVWMRT